MSFNIQTHREITQVETVQDPSLKIMKWGRTNSFPQTLKNLIEQSPIAKSAVGRTAKFYKGKGFIGEDEIVNPYGMTLKQVVSILADDYSIFEAYALHTNYNLNGKVASIIPMRIAELRFNEFDELSYASKLGYHSNFGLNSEVVKTITTVVTRGKIHWINRFNPNTVLAEIAKTEKGLPNYAGQILYHSEAGHSSYPLPVLQAPINYVLSDIENSILVRKESATGFISSYLLKTTMDNSDPNLIALENAIDDAQGARGSGKVITVSGLSPEDMQGTLLEEIGSGSRDKIIDSCTAAYELAHRVINGAYLVPPILSGADQKTGFSQADLKDAYFVFNSVTQNGRDTIEEGINRILEHSIFNTKKIKIEKLTLDEEVVVEEAPQGQPVTKE